MEKSKLKKIVAWMCRKPANIKTLKGKKRIQRNEPCYCGSGKKFKHCCFLKHAVLREGTMTPEMANYVKKQDAFFAKKGKVHG